MIDGILIESLKVLSDARGKVMHMLRCDAPFFKQFGEVYFSIVNPGVIKGWKKHLSMTQHFAVPVGDIKLVIYDDRENSRTKGEIQEIHLGIENYQLVKIPPLIWYSFKAMGDEFALIANCTDLPHAPNESEQLPVSDSYIPYNWG